MSARCQRSNKGSRWYGRVIEVESSQGRTRTTNDFSCLCADFGASTVAISERYVERTIHRTEGQECEDVEEKVI